KINEAEAGNQYILISDQATNSWTVVRQMCSEQLAEDVLELLSSSDGLIHMDCSMLRFRLHGKVNNREMQLRREISESVVIRGPISDERMAKNLFRLPPTLVSSTVYGHDGRLKSGSSYRQ